MRVFARENAAPVGGHRRPPQTSEKTRVEWAFFFPFGRLVPRWRRDEEAFARLAAGETSTTIGRHYNVSHTTILRLRP